MTCQCPDPKPYTKPSGKVICLNAGCGLPIVPKAAPKEQP